MRASKFLGVCAAALITGGISTASSAAVLYDSEGFEPTTFANDVALEGQDPLDGPWTKAALGGVTTTATVQNDVFLGSQAVQLNRNVGDAYWGVQKLVPDVSFTSNNLIVVEWDMYVVQSTTSQNFGPFFGAQANDAHDNLTPVLLAGSLGMDAKTGDVLYQAEGTGALTETGLILPFEQWHHFRLVFDYGQDSYSGYVTPNGGVQQLLVSGEGFVDDAFEEIDDFTDAPIFGVAAEPGSGGTGTAYFDNYVVQQVPEPSALAALGILGLGILGRRRA
jgi:hypothetical protein